MNGFAQHGIKHLSASSLNLWTNAPDVWIAEKLFGKCGPASPAMWRGIAVEQAVRAVLGEGQALSVALTAAHDAFDTQFLIADERVAKEREVIAPMTAIAVDALERYGAPSFPDEGGQWKVELTCRCDGFDLPVIGYLDFVFGECGVVIDLKTTMRMPSIMSPEHQLQRAIYQKAKGNHHVFFGYVTPKKYQEHDHGDPAALLANVKPTISRLEKILRDRTPEEIATLMPVNPRSFYWNNAEAIRREIYGV